MAIHVKVPVHVANQASLFVLNLHVTNGGAYALGHVVFHKDATCSGSRTLHSYSNHWILANRVGK
jgi:hypothetical protein